MTKPTPQSEVLGQLLSLQGSMEVIQGADELSAFTCEGLQNVPGVEFVEFLRDSRSILKDSARVNLPVASINKEYGIFSFVPGNMVQFDLYRPFLQNLAQSMALVLESRDYQRDFNRAQSELEARVEGCSAELIGENQERNVAEKNLRTITDNLPVLISYVDSDERYRFCNKAYEQWCGYDIGQIYGKKIVEVLGEENHKKIKGHIDKVLSGEFVNFETSIRKNNWPIRFIDATYVPDRDEDDKVNGFFVLVQDITERKKIEDAFRQSARLLEAHKSAHTEFITGGAGNALCSNLLSNFISLTESECGFIGEVKSRDDGSPFLNVHAITSDSWNGAMSKFYDDYTAGNMELGSLDTLIGEVMVTGEPVLSNEPSIDIRGSDLPEGHPRINSFLGIPLYSGTNMVGLVGLANRQGGYNDKVAPFLSTFLATCAGIIDAHKSDLKRRDAEEALAQSLKEKEVLIREIHHRVKNNLQIISGLLMIQQQAMRRDSAISVEDAFEESRSRIKSMAVIHDLLYRSGELTGIDILESADMVGVDLIKVFGMKERVVFETVGESVKLDIDIVIPAILIINELIMNSLKHGFPDGRQGHVELAVAEDALGYVMITVSDNGVGIKKDMDWKNPDSIGLDIINGLSAQLDATIELDRSAGTSFTIRFKKQ